MGHDDVVGKQNIFVLDDVETPQILNPGCLQSESVYENPLSLSTQSLKILEFIIQDVNVTVGVLFTAVQLFYSYSVLHELGNI